jgi:putative oxidoreductase
MKILTIIVRSLLGLVFVVFGSNVFLQFIPAPPPEGLARDFTKALFWLPASPAPRPDSSPGPA